MKDRRFPLLPVLVVVALLGTLIAAMMADVTPTTRSIETDVSLPASNATP